MVIGTAFYARVFEVTDTLSNGLNRPGKFRSFIPYRDLLKDHSPAQGFVAYWDEQAQAPYSFNAEKKLFATYDDLRSIRLKTEYAIGKGLDGVMFWELTLDQPGGGLLNEIYKVKMAARTTAFQPGSSGYRATSPSAGPVVYRK
jgi:chitinase